jgi:hypothetical protein
MAELDAACAKVPALSFKRRASGSTAGATDKFSPSCGGRSAAGGSPDRVYRFAVPRRMSVRLVLETQGFRGVLSLRRACVDDATEVKCADANDDSSRAIVQATLDPGTYFAVVDGAGNGSEGAYTLALDGEAAPERGTSERSGRPKAP